MDASPGVLGANGSVCTLLAPDTMTGSPLPVAASVSAPTLPVLLGTAGVGAGVCLKCTRMRGDV